MSHYSNLLSKKEKIAVLQAIAFHTDGEKADNYISACLWDADRTRIAWVMGYQEKYFQTQRAKVVASSNYQDYLQYQAKCLSVPYQDKELIGEYQIKFRRFRYKQLIHILKLTLSKREKE